MNTQSEGLVIAIVVLAVLLFVLGLNLLGEGLRQSLSPKQ